MGATVEIDTSGDPHDSFVGVHVCCLDDETIAVKNGGGVYSDSTMVYHTSLVVGRR